MSNITIVTGIWNIKRDELSEGWSRTYQHYLNNLEKLMKVSDNMIIYIEEEYKRINDLELARELDLFQNPDKDISLYINSPGGSVSAGLAIFDTMQYIKPQIQTVCLGQAASAAAVLLAGGAPGKRLALPNSTILIHQPASGGGGRGQASDIEIQAAEILRMRVWLEETIAKHSKKTVEEVSKDIERDKILTAAQALEYGLIDQVLTSRKA